VKAQWLEVWRISYRLRRGSVWSDPLDVHVLGDKDGLVVVERLKVALGAGRNPPDEVRVVNVENKLSRVALLPGTEWEWREDA
jgi:hypothetical protein